MFNDSRIAEAMRAYVLETAPVLAICLDANHCVVAANAQARQVFCAEAFGRPLAEQIVDFNRTLDLPALIKQTGVVHRLTLNTLSRTPETLNFRFFPLADGTLVLASLDFHEEQKLRDDVLKLNQELNNLTRQLHQTNAELRDLNALKNRFIGMAAHDLRKPIGVVMTYTEFLIDEASEKLDDEQRGFLRASLTAATGMKRLIDNFLDVSVIESGQLRMEPTRSTVAEILASALPLVRLIAAKKKVEMLSDAGGDTRPLYVDVGKLQQALVNLAGNAIDYSKAGQRVWLGARRNDTEAIFSVRDEGPGISPDDQKRLFAAFGRAGTRKTAGERSTGLGLTIARLIVESHGGRIWVESTPGAGSTFLFSLPIQGKSQAQEARKP